MLDRLIDLILQWVEWLLPFAVIDQFERGVVLRLGVFQRLVEPGFHWVVPFGIDRVLTDNVVPRTHNLGAQSLPTKDGHMIVLSAVVTLRIHDVKKAILEVEHVDDAVKDSCYAEIATVVHRHTWDEIQGGEDIADELLRACRKRAFQYGVEVMRVQLSDLAKTRTYRLMSN
jgi:regulator of protease activity HflC (stomatin/prohibitin superfamily)